MKYTYFANVMAQVEFEIEADSVEEADELASERLEATSWNDFVEIGHEIGRHTRNGSWDLVEQDGM